MKIGEINHKKGTVYGSQIRGKKREAIAELCESMEPHRIYNQLATKHKDIIKKYGNVSNLPPKGYATKTFFYQQFN